MPVIVVAPNNELLDKLRSNMQEVRARGGKLIVFADSATRVRQEPRLARRKQASCGPAQPVS